MKYCPNCGNQVPENAQHCPGCGNLLPVRKFSPVPYYLAGVVVLVLVGVLLGDLLKNRTPSAPAVNLSPAGAPGEGPAGDQPATQEMPTQTQLFPADLPSATATSTQPVPSDRPIGKIVFTCQIFRDNARNQICIMNADGSGQRRLTTDDTANHYYPSMAPDGQSIVFTSNQSGRDEIYEMDMNGSQTRLTSLGRLYAPEISPDGRHIVFTNSGGVVSSIWIMDRDGSDPHLLYGREGVEAADPTWSPDGLRVLFAMGIGDDKKLYTVSVDGSDLQLVNNDFITRGRSDWSPGGRQIAGYSGERWHRKIYLMSQDGSDLLEFLQEGNVQAPSFSPDGGWIALTGYLDSMGDNNGCEIYIVKLSSGMPQQLTDKDYCNWQPRWGL